MNHTVTDDDRRLFITTYYDQIENAAKTARIHMAAGTGGRPEIVDYMFKFIGQLAEHGQQFKWPDPAKLALTARQDPALQKLLMRASKSTPIRARQAKQGGTA